MVRASIIVGALSLAGGIATGPAFADPAAIHLVAAGSLQVALSEIIGQFSSAEKIPVEIAFGPSGVLRGRIENGEKADLFASADMGNPLALSRAGKAGPVVLFARNRLCALVRPGLDITSATLLQAMLDPTLKLGTSTPKADPSGDYTWAMFAKADAARPGSRAALEAKALRLMGGPDSPRPPHGTNLFAWLLGEKRADIFIAYCSAGPDFLAHMPGARVVALPAGLATGADYGLTVLSGASPDAAKLALYILSQAGQAVLAKSGFDAPLLTSGQP